jgi:hypothetical protein
MVRLATAWSRSGSPPVRWTVQSGVQYVSDTAWRCPAGLLGAGLGVGQVVHLHRDASPAPSAGSPSRWPASAQARSRET